MFGLEFALFFGLPKNKMELADGYTRWVFPFRSREWAEAHFESWLATVCRWKQVEPSPVEINGWSWQAESAGVRVKLYPKPIELLVPISFELYEAFYSTFHRRDFWPGQPLGYETGRDNWIDLGDIRMRLWSLLKDLSKKHGGEYSSRTDIMISETAGVTPAAYYYRPGRENIMIDGNFFREGPDLVAEVLSAPSRSLDRGERQEIYRRAGVRHLWLLEPLLETVEVYRLADEYELVGKFNADESFACGLFPGESIEVEPLFDTQWKRRPHSMKAMEPAEADEADDAIPQWLIPRNVPVGLEYFFLLGHPQHRWEFWNNRARSVLAFGSEDEARGRLAHFATEAAHWEGLPGAQATPLSPEVDQAEIGRFQLTRRGRLVHCDIAVDGRQYLELLHLWEADDVWDWGED